MVRKRWIVFGGIWVVIGLSFLITDSWFLLHPADLSSDWPTFIELLVDGVICAAGGVWIVRNELRDNENGTLNANKQ